MGKSDMKSFGGSFFGQAIKAAGVGAALMLSVSAGHAQSGPFAGFELVKCVPFFSPTPSHFPKNHIHK